MAGKIKQIRVARRKRHSKTRRKPDPKRSRAAKEGWKKRRRKQGLKDLAGAALDATNPVPKAKIILRAVRGALKIAMPEKYARSPLKYLDKVP